MSKILFLQVYSPQNLDIESRLKAQYPLVSEIDLLLWKWPPSFLNGLQNGGYNGMVYSAIFFSEMPAPQNLEIESKLKSLRLLVSEIDVLLRKWPPFCINGLQNGGYNGMMSSAILFLKSTPQKTYI